MESNEVEKSLAITSLSNSIRRCVAAGITQERLAEQVIGYTPIEVGIALSLYGFNVSPAERARKLYAHFQGDCMEVEELIDILEHRCAFAMTEFPYPTAKVYLHHALEKYGEQARERCRLNKEYHSQ